jgi:hypothetical protein
VRAVDIVTVISPVSKVHIWILLIILTTLFERSGLIRIKTWTLFSYISVAGIRIGNTNKQEPISRISIHVPTPGGK